MKFGVHAPDLIQRTWCCHRTCMHAQRIHHVFMIIISSKHACMSCCCLIQDALTTATRKANYTREVDDRKWFNYEVNGPVGTPKYFILKQDIVTKNTALISTAAGNNNTLPCNTLHVWSASNSMTSSMSLHLKLNQCVTISALQATFMHAGVQLSCHHHVG